MHVSFTTISNIRHAVIDGKTLVPLSDFLSSSVFSKTSPPKYFLEPATNKIYSIATGSLRYLTGTKGTSAAELGDTVFTFVNRRFTMSEISVQFANYVSRSSFGYAYSKWKPAYITPKPAQSSTAAANKNAAVANGNVIIGTQAPNGTVSFSSAPVIHTTEASWKTEIERLAKSNPGTKFIAVQVVASVVAGGLVWN